jgi:uncharacterized protein YegJ (DUF2314 family)
MLSVLLCVVLLFSCQKSSELTVSGGPAKVTAVRAEQMGEIERIAEDAQDTLPGFFRHLNRKGVGEEHFCVKYPFPADEGSGFAREQVWLTGIHFKDGAYYGILANTPQYASGMKKGDTLIFEIDGITDWMYIQGGKIIGGGSIKYFLEQIPEYQRNDSEWELLRMIY